MDVANLKHSSLTLADGRMRGVATKMLRGREIFRNSHDSRCGGATNGRCPGQPAVDKEATGTNVIVAKAINIFFHVN